jgi:hypothetical protein
MPYNEPMLDPVDMYVLLKIASLQGNTDWSQGQMAVQIGVSPSTVNRALKRAAEVNLYQPARKKMNMRALEEALVHGAKYFLAPKRGGEVRGTPTAWAAPPLSEQIASSDPLPPVWPDPFGETRGFAVEPLHPSASKAAPREPQFYALLALADALRLGDNRERHLAQKELHRILCQG